MTCSIFRYTANLFIELFECKFVCLELQLVLRFVIGLIPGTCEQIGPKASNGRRPCRNIQQRFNCILKKNMSYEIENGVAYNKQTFYWWILFCV